MSLHPRMWLVDLSPCTPPHIPTSVSDSPGRGTEPQAYRPPLSRFQDRLTALSPGLSGPHLLHPPASGMLSRAFPGLQREEGPRMLPPASCGCQNLGDIPVWRLRCPWGPALLEAGWCPSCLGVILPTPPYLTVAWGPHPSFLPILLPETSLLRMSRQFLLNKEMLQQPPFPPKGIKSFKRKFRKDSWQEQWGLR